MTGEGRAVGPREACGVAGAWGEGDTAALVRGMLIALQHRGQESAGIVVADDGGFAERVQFGGVREVFPDDDLPDGAGSLGHVRYSTSGDGRRGAQPIVLGAANGPEPQLAVAHNGALVDPHPAARELGVAVPDDLTDSEVIAQLLYVSMSGGRRTLAAAAGAVLPKLTGAYSLVLSDGERLVGVRDPHGFHPLCLGRCGATWLLSSEPAAIRDVGGEPLRDLEPGEVLEVNQQGVSSARLPVSDVRPSRCLFEYIYFARPDSELGGRSVYEARHRAGRALGADAPPPKSSRSDAVVVAAPETARAAAAGYARETGLPLVQGLVRRADTGRSFITKGQGARERAVRRKLSAVPSAVSGRDVVVVDDSMVRGTTMRTLVGMLRQAGASRVHVRIAAPPYRWPCFYGMDTGRPEELVAAQVPVSDLADHLSCDSVEFLGVQRLVTAVDGRHRGFCTACFTGRYPTATPSTTEGTP
ncbi:amidophosphoribosyltransferase [Actinomadura sp. SCN-SB]|uniref:amidophosphoribosyltransferase n=1 Tax=Actinomadura sp. SCN-SB TaxID=3373092 RepID=UPI003752B37E